MVLIAKTPDDKDAKPRFRKDAARAVFSWDKETEDSWKRAFEALGDRVFNEDTKANQTHKPKLHLQVLSDEEMDRIRERDGTIEESAESKLGKWIVDFPSK